MLLFKVNVLKEHGVVNYLMCWTESEGLFASEEDRVSVDVKHCGVLNGLRLSKTSHCVSPYLLASTSYSIV